MIEVKNTPGPWRTELCGRYKRGHYIVAEGVGRPSRVGYAYSDIRRMHLGEEEANARLIAAAPDLLAACEALLRFAESVRPGGGVLAGEHDMLRDARAAISKAGGAA